MFEEILKYNKYIEKPSLFLKEELDFDTKTYEFQSSLIDEFFKMENGIDKYSYLILKGGRRGGKSYFISDMICYQIFRFTFLNIENLINEKIKRKVKLEELNIINASNTSDSATKIYNYTLKHIKTNYENEGYFYKLYNKFGEDYEFKEVFNTIPSRNTLKFSYNGIDYIFKSGSSNIDSLIGNASIFAVIDEFAYFKDKDTGPDGAWYAIEQILPTLVTANPYSKFAIISTPVPKNKGEQCPMTKIYNSTKEGKKPFTHRAIVKHAPTWILNPTISKEECLIMSGAIRQKNGELNLDEVDWNFFYSQFLADTSKVILVKDTRFFNSKHIELLRDDMQNILQEKIVDDKIRFLGIDPAYKSDGFGIAIGYIDQENQKFVIDGTELLTPETKAVDKIEYIRNLCETYNIIGVAYDIYQFPTLSEYFDEKYGELSIRQYVQKDKYTLFKDYLEAGKIDIPYSEELEKDMNSIIVKNERAVDHIRTGTKDLIDAVVQCFSLMYKVSTEYTIATTDKIIYTIINEY